MTEMDPRLRCRCVFDEKMRDSLGEQGRIFGCEARATQEDGLCDGCRAVQHFHLQPTAGTAPVRGVAFTDAVFEGFAGFSGHRVMGVGRDVIDLLDTP